MILSEERIYRAIYLWISRLQWQYMASFYKGRIWIVPDCFQLAKLEYCGGIIHGHNHLAACCGIYQIRSHVKVLTIYMWASFQYHPIRRFLDEQRWKFTAASCFHYLFPLSWWFYLATVNVLRGLIHTRNCLASRCQLPLVVTSQCGLQLTMSLLLDCLVH